MLADRRRRDRRHRRLARQGKWRRAARLAQAQARELRAELDGSSATSGRPNAAAGARQVDRAAADHPAAGGVAGEFCEISAWQARQNVCAR